MSLHDSQARHLHVDPAWLDLRQEEIIDPDLPIIDPHHHLWDRPGWRYLFDDLLADLRSGHDVRATVFVQARAMYRPEGSERLRPLGETEFAVSAAAMGASGAYGHVRPCSGIVAHADLLLGREVAEVLDAHRAVAGARLKGIRHSTAWDADSAVANPELGTEARMLSNPAFREGFAELAPRGLVFDAWVYHPQIDELADLARFFPQTQIVVDHVGGPIGIGGYAGRRDQELERWKASMRRLAECPNVAVKLGGLAMRISGTDFHSAPMPPSSEQLADAFGPRILFAIDTFGADRCMFESNFPVDKASCSYRVLWNAFKRISSGASESEKRMLFHDNAARVYGLAQV
jgi:predicted TIM-barrel fold metal-dependent hydrolase